MIILFGLLRASVLTCLLSLFLVPLASGQLAPTQRVPRSVPLETYDNINCSGGGVVLLIVQFVIVVVSPS